MRSRYKIPGDYNRKIGRAMHDYSMFSHGDRVLVAVSGGIDSLTVSCILNSWQKKAPIDFKLVFLHIDHGFWREVEGAKSPEKMIGEQLTNKDIALTIVKEWSLGEKERTCFLCARNRRSQLFNIARQQGFNKICLGHHKDDLIETFMINAMYSGNISTMVPRQDLFKGSLSIVRPMAYLEKEQVVDIGTGFGLSAVKDFCAVSKDSRRERVRTILHSMYQREPGVKKSIFAALGNVRNEYLLKEKRD